MKKLNIILLSVVLLSFSACTKQEKMNIYEFIKEAEYKQLFNIDENNFRLFESNGEKYYCCFFGTDIIIRLFTEDDGVSINECSVTYLSKAKQADEICIATANALTQGTDGEKLFNVAIKNKACELNDFKAVIIDCDESLTFLINKSSDERNTNQYPTLKRTVKNEDVTRPTYTQ